MWYTIEEEDNPAVLVVNGKDAMLGGRGPFLPRSQGKKGKV
jgi:hypothetical protein